MTKVKKTFKEFLDILKDGNVKLNFPMPVYSKKNSLYGELVSYIRCSDDGDIYFNPNVLEEDIFIPIEIDERKNINHRFLFIVTNNGLKTQLLKNKSIQYIEKNQLLRYTDNVIIYSIKENNELEKIYENGELV